MQAYRASMTTSRAVQNGSRIQRINVYAECMADGRIAQNGVHLYGYVTSDRSVERSGYVSQCWFHPSTGEPPKKLALVAGWMAGAVNYSRSIIGLFKPWADE